MLKIFENPVKLSEDNLCPIEEIGEIDGIRIFHSDKYVRFIGNTAGAIFMKSMLVNEDYSDDMDDDCFPEPYKAIILDDWAMSQPSYVREFMIYHEMGHLVHKHDHIVDELFGSYDNYVIARTNNSKEVYQLEVEADSYAVEIIGSSLAKKAINTIAEMLKEEYNGFESPEIDYRLANM